MMDCQLKIFDYKLSRFDTLPGRDGLTHYDTTQESGHIAMHSIARV